MKQAEKKKLIALAVAAVLIMAAGIVAADRLGVGDFRVPLSRGSQELDNLQAESAIVLDAGSGEILFDKNAHARMYPASTTKILTALAAIESGCLNDKVVVDKEIYRIPLDASKAGLRLGERITMKELLRGLLLPSGNDAAQTIAVHVARIRLHRKSLAVPEAVAAFADFMNERAVRCGAVESHFVNPDGYHHPRHYSTAFDMALIAREAMKHSFFRETVGMDSYRRPGIEAASAVIPYKARSRRTGSTFRGQKSSPVPGRPAVWENRNKLIDGWSPFGFAGATGIKTGHTEAAGYCLVASAFRNGRSLISVVLKSTEKGVWTDSIKLLTFGFTGDGQPVTETVEGL